MDARQLRYRLEYAVFCTIVFVIQSLPLTTAARLTDALALLSRQNGIPSALAVRVLRMVQAGIRAGPRAILKSAATKAQSVHILGDSMLSPLREEFGGLVITAACDPTLRDVLASSSGPRVHIGGLEVAYPLVHGVAECSKFKRA